MDCEFAIYYEECECVGFAKEFHMTVYCQKCWGKRKLAKVKEDYKNLFFVCHICNGSGENEFGICKRCESKGYLDWVGEVVP